jgi:hypothetical protein
MAVLISTVRTAASHLFHTFLHNNVHNIHGFVWLIHSYLRNLSRKCYAIRHFAPPWIWESGFWNVVGLYVCWMYALLALVWFGGLDSYLGIHKFVHHMSALDAYEHSSSKNKDLR